MHCRFKISRLQNGLAEIRIVIPDSLSPECDLEGKEALKKLASWTCAYVHGMAQGIGFDLGLRLRNLGQAVGDAMDHNQNIVSVLTKVQAGGQTLDDLESDPPAGMTPKTARCTAEHLVSQGVLVITHNDILFVSTN